MVIILLLYSFGLNIYKPFNTKVWAWCIFAWSIILAILLAVSGLVLVMECHMDVCNQIIGITAASMMHCTASLCSAFLSYLQYPKRERHQINSLSIDCKTDSTRDMYSPVYQEP